MSLALAITSSSSLKRKTGATGPNVSSFATSIEEFDTRDDRRLVEGAAKRMALAADHHLRALLLRVGDVSSTFLTAASLISGPCVTPAPAVADHELRYHRAALRDELVVNPLCA